MTEQQPFEDILDEALTRLLAGEAPDHILHSFPQHAEALRPALRSAVPVTASVPNPTDAARASALHSMLDSVQATKGAGHSLAIKFGGTAMIMAWFRKRPFAYGSTAAVASIVLLGGVAAGASAAGAAPEPVREFFGFQSQSSIEVELDGVISAINATDGTLTVETANDVRTVVVTDATELSDGGDSIEFGDLAVGNAVEVQGSLQPDNTILASRVHREDEADDDDNDIQTPEATPGADTPTPAVTPDENDADQEDNSGPGSGQNDDADQEDNAGPGNGEMDDADEGDNSGPDDGEGDDVDESDNSGAGNGENDDADAEDNSGPGDGDENDAAGADNSGTGDGDNNDVDEPEADAEVESQEDDHSGPGAQMTTQHEEGDD